MTNTTLSPNTNKGKKVKGESYNLGRLGVGDLVQIGKTKRGKITGRVPCDPKTKKGGSTTVQWPDGPLTYSWDDYGHMQLIWLGEDGIK